MNISPFFPAWNSRWYNRGGCSEVVTLLSTDYIHSCLVVVSLLHQWPRSTWMIQNYIPTEELLCMCSHSWVSTQFIYFCFIDYAKAFDCVGHRKLWQVVKEIGLLDHLIYLWRNLYGEQEATARTGYETTNWFKIGKGIWQGCILPPCLFDLYSEYIMRKAGLEESQTGIKIAGRNINNNMQIIPLWWQKVRRN